MSRKDDRLLMRDVHFSLSSSVPDNQVHLSYITKEPATPANTIEVTDYTSTITENVNRFNSWQKFAVRSEPIITDTAINSPVFGNPSGVVNNDFPLAGWRRELVQEFEGGPGGGMSIESKDIFISSTYNYETETGMNFTSLRLHIHPSGDMPDGYSNPGTNFQAMMYDPTVYMLVSIATPPFGAAELCFDGDYTFQRKADGTHEGAYDIAMQNVVFAPSGSHVAIHTYTRSKPELKEPMGGYVLFLGVSEHGSEAVIDFMSQSYYDIGNYYTSDDPLGFPAGLNCPPGADGNLYMGNFMNYQCGGSSGVPNIDIIGTPAQGAYVPEFITIDINGIGLPIDNVMGQVAMQITNTAINDGVPSRPDIPLTWEYVLRFDHQINTGDVNSSIALVDEVGRVIPPNRYSIEQLVPHASEPRLPNVFKIKLLLPESLVRQSSKTISVRYNKCLNGQVQTNYSEVINARSRSLPEFDYYIDYGYTVPRIQFRRGGNLAGMTHEQFGGTHVWAKLADTLKLSVAPPIAGVYDAWYPRIHAGAFKKFAQTIHTSTGLQTTDIIYFTPEQNRQPCSVNWATQATELAASGSPRLNKFIHESCAIVNSTTLRMLHNNVYFWDGDKSTDPVHGGFAHRKPGWPLYDVPNLQDWHPDRNSFDATELEPTLFRAPKYSHGINIYKNGEIVDNKIIKDWDFFNGLVFLNQPIDYDDAIEVTYLAEQAWVVGRTLDLNPTTTHLEASGVNKTFRLVLKPHWDTYSADTYDPDVNYKLAWHHLHDNRTGKYNATWTPVGELVANSTIGYDFTRSNITVGLPDGTIVLGDVSIREHSINAVSIIDARVRGGGLKNDAWFTEQRQLHTRRPSMGVGARAIQQKESKYYWDIGYWDGEPYQGDSVLVVQLPISKRTDLHDTIVNEGVGKTNIRISERILVDNYYTNNSKYNYRAITDGITNASYLTAIREYIDLQLNAWNAADVEIHRIIKKYIAFGSFYVIMDETGELWP